MLKRILCLILLLLLGDSMFAQTEDSTYKLPNRLAITSLKNPKKQQLIDTNGVIFIVFVNQSDTLVQLRQRQLSGELVSYSDSSMTILVDEENALSQYYNGTMEDFHYWKTRDSTQSRIITVLFTEIHTIRFDKGTYRQVIRLFQSTAYLYMASNIAVLAFSLVTKKPSIVGGKNLLLSTGIAIGAGSASFIFYPKLFLVKNQVHKKKRIKWKIEVI